MGCQLFLYHIKTGLNEEQLFVSMAKEVSAAVFDFKHKESRDVSEFKSFCVAYMVSSRYGVDTKGFRFEIGRAHV